LAGATSTQAKTLHHRHQKQQGLHLQQKKLVQIQSHYQERRQLQEVVESLDKETTQKSTAM
jgi:hypothetical protein